mgnify:CR=1 FL=1
MVNRLFIIDNGGISLQYGIGTYLNELVGALENSNFEIVIVEIFSYHSSIEKVVKGHCTYLYLPDWSQECKLEIDYEYQYLRNVVAYLAIHFNSDSDNIPIFHLNFVNSYFIKTLKRYIDCFVIVTIHFTPWDFVYKGDEDRVLQLWCGRYKLNSLDTGSLIKQIENFYQSFILCDKIICLTQRRKAYFLKMFDIDMDKYIVIPNALNDKYVLYDPIKIISNKSKLLKNSKVKIILYVGRLDSGKNIDSLIRCYKRTLKVYSDSHLIIVGSGNYEQLLQVIGLEAIDKISFVGFLDRKKLMEIYGVADIGVMCSIHEEFGYVGVEMMMNSIPLIISESSGIAEYMGDYCAKIPVVCKERKIDEELLYQLLLELLTDDELSVKMANLVRTKYEESFSISLYTTKMMALYKSFFSN